MIMYGKQNNSGGWAPVGTLNFYPISSIATSPGTHEYRLKVTSVNDNNCIDRYTNTVTIEVYEEFTAQITTLDQDICYNTLPDNQLEVLASGADNNFTYQWYSKFYSDPNSFSNKWVVNPTLCQQVH